MGTRGLLGVVVENQPKAAYVHFDSYPSGLGEDVLKFARSLDLKDVSALRKAFAKLKLIDETSTPTKPQRDKLEALGVSPAQVSTGSDWYSWLRDAQGDLAEYLRIGFMPDNTKFGNDSLFCEWGYLINLDNLTLEVYRGFQTAPHSDGFWAEYDPTKDEGVSYRMENYYGIRRIKVYDLGNLPESLAGIEEEVYAAEEAAAAV